MTAISPLGGIAAPLSRMLPPGLLARLAMAAPTVAGRGLREGATARMCASAGLSADRGGATAVAAGLPGALVLVAEWLSRRRLSPLTEPVPVVVRPKRATDA